MGSSNLKIIHEKDDVNFLYVFQYAAIGMAIVDLDGHWLDVNAALCNMTGYSKRELLAKTFQDITYPDDLETDLRFVEKILRNEIDHYQMEKRYICKNGDLLWVSLNVSLVRNPQGQALYFIAQIENINHRKKTEIALQDSEERWHFALEGSNAGVWDWNLETHELFFSKRWKEMLGYQDHEIGNKLTEWSSRIHRDDLKKCYEDLEKHFSNQSSYYSNEHRMLCKNGEYIWILDRGKIIARDATGKPLRMIGTHTDVTERKIIEQQINDREILFRSIFNNAGVGILVLDARENFVFGNNTIFKLLGRTADEVKKIKFSNILSKKSKSDYRNFFQDMMNRKIDQINMEVIIKTPLGDFNSHLTASCNFHQKNDELLIIQVLTDITQRKTQEENLIFQAFYDPLTNLPNQFLLFEQLKKTLSNKNNTTAIIYLDIKSLKDINNIEGRDVGDELLKILAKKFEYCISENDMVARFGDDEFAFIINSVKSKESLEQLVKKIMKTIEKPFSINNSKITISCSCGIVLVNNDFTDPHMILTKAEIAMQQAKEKKLNHYEFFTEEYYQERIETTTMKYEINEALINEDFFLVYQPIIDLKTAKIAKIEVLIRWQHPKRGLILPEIFLNVARKSKQILEIDSWVVHNICNQLEKHLDHHHNIPMVTINITAGQILDPEFIHYITKEVDPRIREKICLEILESEFVERSNAIFDALKKLKNEKIKIAIDDFGAGYSSLTYLRDFPVDYLKLDRSLMEDLKIKINKNHHLLKNRNLIFLSSVINLGQALGCIVIAEGVETAIQDQNLRLLGCDHGQGYFYSPLIDDLDQLITNDNFLQ